ncbi:hypothetical protein AJ79_00751 [Helicocarpus griseus UAMH5409]|uniref:Uncharacterized protein n=1 Tax=Helicocarpus griseus UAMH5409 TaxID=1447875 RepID=A0A2B7YAR0_9EURO|nr:hypothetical protein AJ79_00751 [Helicocarpus griseus UAMH5409]
MGSGLRSSPQNAWVLFLADLVIKSRKAVLSASSQFTDDVITLAENLKDLNRLAPTAMLDAPGFNCIQSSWATFEMYSCNGDLC